MSNVQYFATVLTMALQTPRPGLHAKALGRLAAELDARALASFVHDGVVVLYANAPAMELLGPRRRLVGASVRSLVHRSRHAALDAALAGAARGTFDSRWARSVFVDADGAEVSVEARAVAVSFGGSPAIRIDLLGLSTRS